MPATSRPSLSRSSVASRRARTTGLWKSASSTLVPSVIRLVRAATQARVSIGSYTEPKPSGASITGPPGPPMGIGTVGRISRSQTQTESKPIRSASSRDLRDRLGRRVLAGHRQVDTQLD